MDLEVFSQIENLAFRVSCIPRTISALHFLALGPDPLSFGKKGGKRQLLGQSWCKVPTPQSRRLKLGYKPHRFYKTKEKAESQIWRCDDSLNSVEDIGDALIFSVDSSIESLILDSGASFHSSPNKELFWNFKSGNFEKVYLADNKDLEIKGKGDVCIKTPAKNQWTLKDVRYISGL